MSFLLQFDVHHEPAPQGSKKHVGNGRMVESSKKLKPYRNAVKAAAIEAMGGPVGFPVDGELSVQVTFILPRPKYHFGTGRNASRLKNGSPKFASKKPDLDKLLRSTFDAITDAGVWVDDSRAVSVTAIKIYGARPGTRVTINRLGKK